MKEKNSKKVRFSRVSCQLLTSNLYLLAVAVATALLMVASARADEIITVDDWNAGDEGWTANVTIDQTAPDMDISLPAGRSPMNSDWAGLAQVNADTFYGGTWEENMYVTFDFWAEDVVPGWVQVRWGDSTTGRTWKDTVFDSNSSSLAVGDTATVGSAMFSWWSNWGGDAVGTSNDFVTDLGNIDWIGIYIWRGGDGTDEENFGVDNFTLMVPEPPEVFMAISAMLSSVFSLRRKRKQRAAA